MGPVESLPEHLMASGKQTKNPWSDMHHTGARFSNTYQELVTVMDPGDTKVNKSEPLIPKIVYNPDRQTDNNNTLARGTPKWDPIQTWGGSQKKE